MGDEKGHRRSAGGGLTLLAFGAAFAALFAAVAIAQGVGDPSVPAGHVALVEGAPGDVKEISEEEYEHELEVVIAFEGLPAVPEPGEERYWEVKEDAMRELIEAVWAEGEAAELGIAPSDREAAAALRALRDENFQSDAEYREYIEESNYTPSDLDKRARLQLVSTELQERLKESAAQPSEADIERFYEAAKESQFTQPATRDLRVISNESREELERALAILRKDSTAVSWDRVAKERSELSATRDSGGLQQGATEESFGEPLGPAIFEAPEGQLEGPVKVGGNFFAFEVVGSTPERTQSLGEVESQIETQLEQQIEGEEFNAYGAEFAEKWRSRTFCAPGYVIEACSNFEGDGRLDGAPPACYEADPEDGRPLACPAPVAQLTPAMPGSVTPLEPQGSPLPQRPRPGAEEGEEPVPSNFPGGNTPSPPE